jgi:O-antigen ligase
MAAVLIVVAVWVMAIPATWVGLAGRGILLLALFCAFWHDGRLLLSVRVSPRLALFCSLVVAIALGAGAYAHGLNNAILSDLLRQLFALAFVVVLFQLLRKRELLRTYVASYCVLAVIASLILLYLQLSTAGWGAMFDAERLKLAKYELKNNKDIGLNSFSYSIAIAGLLAAGVRQWRWQWRLGLAVYVIAALWAFASTSAIAALILAVFGAVTIWFAVTRLRISPPLIAICGVVAWFGFQVVVIAAALETPWLLEALNDMTTGRLYLWVVAIGVFQTNPTFGEGPFSWKENLLKDLAYVTDETARYEQITGGAYHNVLFTTLAERGLIGAAALVLILGLLFYVCAICLQRRDGTKAVGEMSPIILVTTMVMTLMRGLGEYSGPVAYANSHADFVALSIVAILMASYSSVTQGSLARSRASLPGAHPIAGAPSG